MQNEFNSELMKFKEYISRFSWRNAKTYEAFSPHYFFIPKKSSPIPQDYPQ